MRLLSSLLLLVTSVFSSTVYVTDDTTYPGTLPGGANVKLCDHTNDAQLIQEALCESVGHTFGPGSGCGHYGDDQTLVSTEPGTVIFWLDWEFGDGTGVYDLDENLYVYSDTEVRGHVNGDEIITTVLRVPNNRCQNGETRSGVLIMENQDNIGVHNLRLDGNQCNQNCVNGDGDTGLYIRYCQNIRMSRLEIVHFVKHGVHFRNSQDLEFYFGEDDPFSRVLDNSQYGFMLENSNGVLLDNPSSSLFSLSDTGVRIKSTDNVLIQSDTCVLDDMFGAFVKDQVKLTDSLNLQCVLN